MKGTAYEQLIARGLRVVHKYAIPIEPLGEERKLLVGDNPLFLHVDANRNDIRSLWIWFEVDVDPAKPPSVAFDYMVLGTGRPTDVKDEDRIHLGTVVTDPYVWHLYEVFHDIIPSSDVGP